MLNSGKVQKWITVSETLIGTCNEHNAPSQVEEGMFCSAYITKENAEDNRNIISPEMVSSQYDESNRKVITTSQLQLGI